MSSCQLGVEKEIVERRIMQNIREGQGDQLIEQL